jgi:hypothetical protein
MTVWPAITQNSTPTLALTMVNKAIVASAKKHMTLYNKIL